MITVNKNYRNKWGFQVFSDATGIMVAVQAWGYDTKEGALEAVGHLASAVNDCLLADDPTQIEVCYKDDVHHIKIG